MKEMMGMLYKRVEYVANSTELGGFYVTEILVANLNVK